jgi:hypothetical protein
MATKKQSRPIVEGLANPRGVTAVYGTPIDWGSLPEKIRIGRRIANGRFKLEAHYPAKHFNDKKEYIDKRKAGSYCRFYDKKSPFFIARTVWDGTSQPGMHMVVKNRNETYRFLLTPKANDPTEATVIGAYLVHREDGVPVLCSGPIGELKAVGDDGDFKVTAYKKHGIRCPKKDSSGKDLAGEIPKTFGYIKRTSKKGPRKTAKDYCKPSHTFKHPTDIKRAEVVEEMDAYMDEQCACLMCNWSGAYSDLTFLDDTPEGGPPGMDFILVCPSCGDGDWLDDMMAEGYDEPCFSCDGIGTWDDGDCEYCEGSGMMSDTLRAEMVIYNSEYFDADCGCFKKAEETLVWKDKTLSFMDWAKQEEASHLKKYSAEESAKDFLFVVFGVRDGEREYEIYTILPKSHADSSDRELIEWMWGEDSTGEEPFNVGGSIHSHHYWVDGEMLVIVSRREPITEDLKTTLNSLGLHAESLSSGGEAIQSMADTFEPECITCDEPMGDNSMWGCVCCGMLVGTQGDHEGCGENRDGIVGCNFCIQENHEYLEEIDDVTGEVITHSSCQDILQDVYEMDGAKTFEAPYAGAGATMDIGKDTALSSFTPEELTTSSAIHGDFDQASLDYSGHQNIEVRAEGWGKTCQVEDMTYHHGLITDKPCTAPATVNLQDILMEYEVGEDPYEKMHLGEINEFFCKKHYDEMDDMWAETKGSEHQNIEVRAESSYHLSNTMDESQQEDTDNLKARASSPIIADYVQAMAEWGFNNQDHLLLWESMCLVVEADERGEFDEHIEMLEDNWVGEAESDYVDYTMWIYTKSAGGLFNGEWEDGESEEQVVKEWKESVQEVIDDQGDDLISADLRKHSSYDEDEEGNLTSQHMEFLFDYQHGEDNLADFEAEDDVDWENLTADERIQLLHDAGYPTGYSNPPTWAKPLGYVGALAAGWISASMIDKAKE